MKNFTKLALVVALTIAGTFVAFSQTRSKTEPQEPERIIVERSEVILDAVVRDKRGRPVTNLTVADFAVYEDGVRQQISSFRLVTRGDRNSFGTKPERAPANEKLETKTQAVPASPPADSRTVKPYLTTNPAPFSSLRRLCVLGVAAVSNVSPKLTAEAQSRRGHAEN